MWLFRLVSILFMLPLIAYFYFYVVRSLRFWHVAVDQTWKKLLVLVLAALLCLFCTNIWSLGFILLLHCFAVSAVLDLLGLVLSRLPQIKKVWRPLYRCGFTAPLIVALLFGYGFYNIQHVVRQPYTIATQKNIRDEGYTLAFLSDVHYGLTVDGDELQRYANAIAEEQPDLVLLGGDIVDESTTLEEMQQVFSVLGQIPSAYGVYYIYGNHDRARYSSQPPFTEAQLRQAIEQAGITILQDEALQVTDDLVLVGREDYSAAPARARSAQLLTGVDQSDFILMLDHQPRQLEENREAGVDLQLSGHTHDGQIWPVGLLSRWFNLNELTYGYEQLGSLQVIVSSGFAGWGYPLRTSGQSEYVMIDIEKTASIQ